MKLSATVKDGGHSLREEWATHRRAPRELADTREQGRRLLDRASPSTPVSRADHAMVPLIGCGLRRAKLRLLECPVHADNRHCPGP